MESFGVRLRHALDARGPLCVGLDPHRELLETWRVGDGVDGLRRFCEQTADTALHRVAEQDCRALLAQAERTPLRVVAEHGDFWRRNILRRRGGALVVIDWQHARDGGDELFDFALLAYTHWETWNRLTPRRRPGGSSPVLAAMTERFCRERGLPSALVYAYFPYALMRRMARSLSWPRYNLLRVYREHRFPQPS